MIQLLVINESVNYLECTNSVTSNEVRTQEMLEVCVTQRLVIQGFTHKRIINYEAVPHSFLCKYSHFCVPFIVQCYRKLKFK